MLTYTTSYIRHLVILVQCKQGVLLQLPGASMKMTKGGGEEVNERMQWHTD